MKIFSGLKNYKKEIILSCLFIGLASVADLALPSLMSELIDKGVNANDVSFIYRNGLIMLLVTAFGVACNLIAARTGAVAVNGFGTELINKIFRKVNKMNFDQFSELGPSALLTRTIEDVELMREAVYFLIRMAVSLPVVLIGGIVMSLTKNAKLSFILFAFVPIFILVVVLIGRKMMKLWEVSDKYMDKQSQIMRERLSGIRVIRAFGRENSEHDRIVDATNVMAQNLIRANVMGGFMGPVAMLVLDIAVVLILMIGGSAIQPGGEFSASDIIAVIKYVTLIVSALSMFSWMILFLPRVRVKIKRIGEILDVETEEDNSDGSLVLEGNIRMEKVSFCYEGAENPAVSNIDIDIKKGETVAFIGGTGSGKSTLLQLIMGFYKPTEGNIYFDGKNAGEIAKKDLRSNISCALQKSTIFSATIKENILIGKRDATDEEIERVAEIAEIADYIKTLPDGFSHELEQGGSNLSGGQKQRIAIARAIVKPAAVYIFDDTFSALDFLTESKLRRKLKDYIKGKTQIVITQRISSAMSADKIYVLDNGKMAGFGTHSELIKSCDIYREIYRSQVGGDLNG